MVVDEDPFPPVVSFNITGMDLRAVLNEKKDEKCPSNVKIRKVWIPKQYMVYKDELAVKGKVFTTREKEKKWKVSIPFKKGNQEGETL